MRSCVGQHDLRKLRVATHDLNAPDPVVWTTHLQRLQCLDTFLSISPLSISPQSAAAASKSPVHYTYPSNTPSIQRMLHTILPPNHSPKKIQGFMHRNSKDALVRHTHITDLTPRFLPSALEEQSPSSGIGIIIRRLAVTLTLPTARADGSRLVGPARSRSLHPSFCRNQSAPSNKTRRRKNPPG